MELTQLEYAFAELRMTEARKLAERLAASLSGLDEEAAKRVVGFCAALGIKTTAPPESRSAAERLAPFLAPSTSAAQLDPLLRDSHAGLPSNTLALLAKLRSNNLIHATQLAAALRHHSFIPRHRAQLLRDPAVWRLFVEVRSLGRRKKEGKDGRVVAVSGCDGDDSDGGGGVGRGLLQFLR